MSGFASLLIGEPLASGARDQFFGAHQVGDLERGWPPLEDCAVVQGLADGGSPVIGEIDLDRDILSNAIDLRTVAKVLVERHARAELVLNVDLILGRH